MSKGTQGGEQINLVTCQICVKKGTQNLIIGI